MGTPRGNGENQWIFIGERDYTPVDEANAEPDATGALSDRDDAGFMTSTGADPIGHERSEGPSVPYS